MSNKELRAELHRIIQLTRNPNAPDVLSLEEKSNSFGYEMRKCPACESWEHVKSFYGHWSHVHAPDWKVDMLMELIKGLDTIRLT